MLTRITIDLPKPLAEQISQLAQEHLRYPKQEIVWLLQEAVHARMLPVSAPQREQGEPYAAAR